MANRSGTDPARAGAAAAAAAMADAASIGKEEQARKAHALAEKCFLAGNVRGARQWMQSAVRLAPGLPGTAQAVAAYDVHAAAARSGQPPDWYAVLGLQPPPASLVTHDDVKRQHRRLCLLVHPDKNPCAAADGAFKLVQAAWHALSARHPPGAAAATVPKANQPQPPPPRPAPPPPRPTPPPRQAAPPPQPRPRPRPQFVPMPRRAPAPTMPTYAQQASRYKPPPEKPWPRYKPPPEKPRPRSRDDCPACGACTPNGKSGPRCGSCLWSPMDNRPDDDDDDYFEEDYY
ncbi:hypothetical protein BAE44_0024368 [Dichanthelium oligosanthes]|uniref:J domain-containing protein n=1 Tax=Dichanthelium oligosanthes TaxID=888268 RepID=A0A1E5UP21_9POAL|nr:hypothetical protein BAE44_0024368 [Dichanthelium oligosanthes]